MRSAKQSAKADSVTKRCGSRVLVDLYSIGIFFIKIKTLPLLLQTVHGGVDLAPIHDEVIEDLYLVCSYTRVTLYARWEVFFVMTSMSFILLSVSCFNIARFGLEPLLAAVTVTLNPVIVLPHKI